MNIINAPKTQSSRIIGLDVLRSIAILLVVLQHGQFLLTDSKTTRSFTQVLNLIDGVSIFFVLSGFLIGKIIINQFIDKDISINTLIKFWCKRWLRTLPNYFLILMIFAILYFIHPKLDFLNIPKSYYLFIQNFQENDLINFKESWSLSVEEWFYFSFPLLLFVACKINSNKNISSVFLSIILLYLLIPFLLRFYTFQFNNHLDFRKIVIYRLDAIIYGVLGAFLASKFKQNWFKNRINFAIIGFFIFALIILNPMNWQQEISPFFFSIESIAILSFIPLLSTVKSLKWKPLNSFFSYISSISYSLYLVNLTLVQMVVLPAIKLNIENSIFFKNNSEIIIYILFWFISIAISTLLYYSFERPILTLRNRIIKD